jgi:hypothetical protein
MPISHRRTATIPAYLLDKLQRADRIPIDWDRTATVREAISDGDLKAKEAWRTIILPNDLRVWLNALPDAARGQSADAQ